MNKNTMSSFLRKLGLLDLADKLRFTIEKGKYQQKNKAFKKQHPHIKLPPDYLMYESHAMSYHSYFFHGKSNAEDVVRRLSKYVSFNNAAILDWGCGPGRIIRHLPALVNNSCTFYGTDYNKKSIEWCQENLKAINFNKNELTAKLPYEDNFFTAIYGLSIFTHLSEEMHHNWFKELYRVLKPGGVMLLTTQGNTYRPKLTRPELIKFDKGELVVRGQVVEGHRLYSAFQPAAFMHKLFSKVEILEHIEQAVQENWYPQDKWIVRKQRVDL